MGKNSAKNKNCEAVRKFISQKTSEKHSLQLYGSFWLGGGFVAIVMKGCVFNSGEQSYRGAFEDGVATLRAREIRL